MIDAPVKCYHPLVFKVRRLNDAGLSAHRVQTIVASLADALRRHASQKTLSRDSARDISDELHRLMTENPKRWTELAEEFFDRFVGNNDDIDSPFSLPLSRISPGLIRAWISPPPKRPLEQHHTANK